MPKASVLPVAESIPFETVCEVRDACLCLASQRAARKLARRFDNAFREQGLTNGQFSLMVFLSGSEQPTIGRLADFLAMDRTTLTALLKTLERRGWVEVARDARDRRTRRISLTAPGARVVADAIPIWRQEHANLESELSPITAEKARASLHALTR